MSKLKPGDIVTIIGCFNNQDIFVVESQLEDIYLSRTYHEPYYMIRSKSNPNFLIPIREGNLQLIKESN